MILLLCRCCCGCRWCWCFPHGKVVVLVLMLSLPLSLSTAGGGFFCCCCRRRGWTGGKCQKRTTPTRGATTRVVRTRVIHGCSYCTYYFYMMIVCSKRMEDNNEMVFSSVPIGEKGEREIYPRCVAVRLVCKSRCCRQGCRACNALQEGCLQRVAGNLPFFVRFCEKLFEIFVRCNGRCFFGRITIRHLHQAT